MGRTTANEIAACFLKLAAEESTPDEVVTLTPMQLQKLLYYAQGWALAEQGKTLFDDPIEAWPHGPVVPAVYHVYKGCRGGPISHSGTPGACELTDFERLMVQEVWENYKRFSALALRDMTHREEPWLQARAGLDPKARSNHRLDIQAMKRWFENQVTAAEARLAAKFDRLEARGQMNMERAKAGFVLT